MPGATAVAQGPLSDRPHRIASTALAATLSAIGLPRAITPTSIFPPMEALTTTWSRACLAKPDRLSGREIAMTRRSAPATPLWFSLALFPWCGEMAFEGLLGAARVLQGRRFIRRSTPCTLATERQRSRHGGGGRFGCFAGNAPAVGPGDSSPVWMRELPSTAHKKRRTP